MAAFTQVEAPEFSAANDELAAYLTEAAEDHPGLQGRHAEWRAALERIPQVTSLDDPMFTYGQFVQSDVSRFKLGLMQKFPWFGTLRARGDKAAEEADAALAKLYSARNKVFDEVKRAYFEYAFLGNSIQVTESQVEILKDMEEIVRSKYILGLATESDLLRVQIEQTKVQDQLDGLNQMRPTLAANLAEALGREHPTQIPWPQESAVPPPPPSVDETLARVREANPDLAALDHLIAGYEKQAELAKKRGYPDFTLGLEYVGISMPRQIRPDRPYPASLHGARRLLTGTTMGTGGTLIDLYSVATYDEPMTYRSGGDDNIMVSLTMNLPIWRERIKSGIREAELKQKATEHEKRRTTLSLDSMAQMAIFGVEDGLRRYNLYRDSLLPKARQTYESLESAYASGGAGADFLDVLDSVQVLLDFELEQVRAARDAHIAAANLEFIMGGPWVSE